MKCANKMSVIEVGALIVYTVEISPNAVKTENKTVPLKSP
jgi:hypothetical protein